LAVRRGDLQSLAEDPSMKPASICFALGFLIGALAPMAQAQELRPFQTFDTAKEAYIYAFPMIGAYKAMYEFNIDAASAQYKGPFNRVHNSAHVFTPKDTAVITPNSDTPYSMVQMDLRAEPIVLCVPAVPKDRYYSVQLTDLYTFNYGYIGSRATGDRAGCYAVAGPNWTGDVPPGIAKVFRSETDFSLAIYRTQLFGPDDMDNVKAIQAGYQAAPLSAFLNQPAPPASPMPDFPKFTDQSFKTDAFAVLNFLLQFAPADQAEKELRARFATIGVAPGRPFVLADLPPLERLSTGLGIREGFKEIQARRETLGKDVNGWRVGASFGDRAFFNGDFLLRAASALAGIYGNDAEEALYPMAMSDSAGEKLDGGKHAYTLTFPEGGTPPVNAFWSVTMYDGKTQLLIDNPIDRYLINSPMLPDLKKNPDGSLTLYIQKDSPGPGRQSNWLPAPDGPFYLVMRLYWPKQAALDGEWKPAPVVRVH
jgi:hypothetical protein